MGPKEILLFKKMVKLLFVFFALISHYSYAFYHEYRLSKFPENLNPVYVRESLKDLILTSDAEDIIEATLKMQSGVTFSLMTFSKEKIRVLIVNDSKTNTQTVNIIPLDNSYDLYYASKSKLTQDNLFTFPTNKYYITKYAQIRERIIREITSNVVKINTIGSASAYGTLLAIELSSLQVAVDTIIMFGPTRFTSTITHDKITNTFGYKMLALTHQHDISHKIMMRIGVADILRNNFIVCMQSQCSNDIFEQEHFSLTKLKKHFSSIPKKYAEIYYNAFLTQNEK